MTDKKSIKEQRKEVFETIYGVSRFSDILDLFQSDYKSIKNKGLSRVQDLYKKYSYAIFFMYSPSSIRNNLVKFKNVIKEEGGKYKTNALDVFTIEEIYSPIKSKDKEVKKALKAKIQDADSANIDPNVVINQIKKLKSDLDTNSHETNTNQKEEQVRAYRIVAMLGLATGRRFTELLKTLVIKKNGTRITFDGLLKGNNEEIEGHIIGLTYKEVQSYLKELRTFANTENMTVSQVNAKYAKVFNNAMVRLVQKGLIDDLPQSEKQGKKYITSGKNKGKTIDIKLFPSAKTMRNRYAMAGSQLFKKEGESITDTITRILGHKEVLISAVNYTRKTQDQSR